MTKNTLVYGRRAAARRRREEAGGSQGAARPSRGGSGRLLGQDAKAASGDLIDAIKEKKVELGKLKDEELPDELKKLKTPKEREEYLKTVEKKRAELNKEAIELDKKRSAYIDAELKKQGKGKDSFDNSVLDMLRKQAKKHEIAY